MQALLNIFLGSPAATPALFAPASPHREDGLGWRWRLVQRRGGEWLETINLPNLPEVEGPQIDWGQFAFLLELARVVFWLALAVLIAIALWQILQSLLPYWRDRADRWQQQRAADAEIVTASTVEDWLAQARNCRTDGDFAGACRCLYFAMLQMLHEQDILSHKRSRTDGEYLRAMQEKSAYPQPYQTLLLVHQQLTFGDRAAIGDETCIRCWDAWQTLDANRLRDGGTQS
ncbi:MAG: DUF4129 domain-containing protein [Cyanobacteria bacterium J06641_5]